MKPRYIDANKLNKKRKYSFQTQGGCFPKSEWFIKADDFFAAPDEDVVEVVRCCECIHKQENPDINNTCFLTCNLSWGLQGVVDPTDFCSYGKRKKID